MPDNDDLGLELMRLYRQLRAVTEPSDRVRIRAQLDRLLDRAQQLLPSRYGTAFHSRREDV